MQITDIAGNPERFVGPLGEFAYFPEHFAGSQDAPAVAAFSSFSLADDDRMSERANNGRRFVDVECDGRRWTYELHEAHRTTPGAERGKLAVRTAFDVGRRID